MQFNFWLTCAGAGKGWSSLSIRFALGQRIDCVKWSQSHVWGSPLGASNKRNKCKALHNISVKPPGVEKWQVFSQNKQSSTQSDLDLLIVFVAKNLISKQRCQQIARIPRAEIPPFTPVGREARWCLELVGHLMKVDGWNFEGTVYKNAI